MSTPEERLMVLKMIQDGKIKAEEGLQILESLGENTSTEFQPTADSGSASSAKGVGRWFHVRVTDTLTGKTKVNVRLPINVISAGIKMGAHFSPEIQSVDPKLLKNAIQSGETGLIVDIVDEDDKERVEVFIE
jgi:hypothetical protein